MNYVCIVLVLANNMLQRATLPRAVDTSKAKSDVLNVSFLFYGRAFGVLAVGDYCEQSPVPGNSKTNYLLVADDFINILNLIIIS